MCFVDKNTTDFLSCLNTKSFMKAYFPPNCSKWAVLCIIVCENSYRIKINPVFIRKTGFIKS